ncbi:MAG: biotin--[acetyl-CoA-carboxylase] ligase [Rhodobacterales bacterium]|nr:MAG: biotin--[acetyl-CoA-carboxylase] ligase [Rhodobacterales bacterium]
MADRSWPAGYGHLPLLEVDSTLDEARRRIGEVQGPVWITARVQTNARGRRGRAWAHPPGNFAGTLLIPRFDDPERAALRSFAAALALSDAFIELTGRPEAFALKWPNDVLCHSGKIAGILLETVSHGGRVAGVAIGIGVNLAEAPPRAVLEPGAVPPVSLAGEFGICPEPEEFLEVLAPAYAAWEARLFTQGFEPLRHAWLARAARLGEVITARLPGEEITGTFRTVDEQGQLVLSTPKGARRIAAGDIFF